LFSPISGAGASNNGLRVLPQKTLALIGGKIALEGGNLTAPGGRVELGSVDNGIVTLNPITSGWVFGYEGLQNFQNIELSKRALVDASGSGNSAVQLVGKQIFLTEGSVALIQNQGAQTGSGINIQASN
ncbi:MAG: two-partner secretion domain-containing protein, partial [Nostoc sp.]